MRRASKLEQKKGSGVLLVIVAAVIFVLFTAAFFQSRLTSSVTAETAAARDGDKAQLIAESAIHEAVVRLKRELSNEDSPLLHMFRKAVYAPARGEFAFGKYIDLTETQTMMAAEGLADFTLEKLDARVAFQRQVDRTAYERKGVICWRAAVKTPRRKWRRSRREVEYTQRFKIALAAPPRPFSSYGIFIGDVETMTDIESINQSREKFITAVNELKQKVEERKNSAPSHFRAQYDDLLSSLAGEKNIRAAVPLPEAASSACYGLIKHGSVMALDRLDVARELREYLIELAPKLEKVERAGSGGDALQIFRDTNSTARAADKILREGLWRIWSFSHVYRVLPSTDNAYAPLAAHFMKFDGSYWRRRAQWLVRKKNKDRSTNDAWEEFLKKHPDLKGVVYVQNDKHPLRINGHFKGPLVIVTGQGGATLEDVNRNDKGKDTLTVVCLGGDVTVRGVVNAALVLGREENDEPHSLTVSKGAKLTGCLSALRLPLRCRFAGHLIRSHKFGYGDAVLPHHLHVELAPRFVYRKVYRR